MNTDLVDSELIDANLLAPLNISPNGSTVDKLQSLKDYMTAFNREPNPEPLAEALAFYETVLNGQIPEEFPQSLSNSRDFSIYTLASGLHTRLNDEGYFARITKHTARDLAEVIGEGVVLDPMAGKGFGVKALREAGVKTIGSDDNSWSISNGIEKLDALDSLCKYGDSIDYLLVSWAPWGSEIDYELLMMARELYPQITIINIGEYNGCTGSKRFWNAAKTVSTREIHYRNVYNIKDFVEFVK